MTNPSSPQHNQGSSADAAISNAEAELLQSVLTTEAYPWRMDESPEYAEAAEAAGQMLEISEAEAVQGWQALSGQLSQIWGEAAETQSSAFQQMFAGRIPAESIARITRKAKQIAANGESMVNQMVACAQEILDEMAAADLQVMARPMAMAMRGQSTDEIVAVTVKSVREAEWETLSPIEQAKLSLAAARCALAAASKAES
ncbi:MAG: hypothetical protein AAF703_10665 [Cyanobacteria bacterium P01_D01_bin.105]